MNDPVPKFKLFGKTLETCELPNSQFVSYAPTESFLVYALARVSRQAIAICSKVCLTDF